MSRPLRLLLRVLALTGRLLSSLPGFLVGMLTALVLAEIPGPVRYTPEEVAGA